MLHEPESAVHPANAGKALWSEDAERAVLAAILLQPDALASVEGVLKPDMFQRGSHRVLFRAMQVVVHSGATLDPLTLSEELIRGNELAAAGGKEAIGGLLDEVPTAANVQHHVAIVRDYAWRRQLQSTGRALVASAGDLQVPTQSLIESTSVALLSQATNTTEKGFEPIGPMLKRALVEIASRGDGNAPPGVSTQIPELDDALGGPPPKGTLVVVAGVPSSGKTSTVWGIELQTALAGGRCAFVSAEMSQSALMNWTYASVAGVPVKHIQSGQLDRLGAAKLVDAYERMRDLPFHVDTTVRPTIEAVVTRCRMLKARYPDLTAIGVDFIQLLQKRDERRSDLREQVLRDIAYDLKSVALECDLVMYALAQVNKKQIAHREDKRPLDTDIAGSGGPLEASDVCLMIHRPGQWSTSDNTELEVAIAKNKFGPSGNVAHLIWEGSHVRVTSVGVREREEKARLERNRQLELEGQR
jgi:replicative DNA helicase